MNRAVITLVGVMCASACSRDLLSMSPPAVGFWYEGTSYVLPTAATNRYDRPLSDGDFEIFGELHWTTALPLLRNKLGEQAER
jgi:hypothetical protein